MTVSSKTFLAGSAAFLLIAGAIGAQQMRIQQLEQFLRIAPGPLTPQLDGVSSSYFNAYVEQLSQRIEDVRLTVRDARVPLFERDALFELVQKYYFAHRSRRLATRTEFLRPTSSFHLNRFSLPNSLLDTYPDHSLYFGTGGNRGDNIPENEQSVFTLNFRETRDEWPPSFSFLRRNEFSVEVRALGMVTPAPDPVTADCAADTDAAILALVPYARQYTYGTISDADLCAAMKLYKTIDGGDYTPYTRLFTLQGQTQTGAWLPTVLFAHTGGGLSHTSIRISASTGNVSRDPSLEEAQRAAKENSALEQDILAGLAKNVHFSMCEYACAY